MSAPSSERRLLRPRYIHFAAGRLWVFDQTQPVAALVEPTSGQIDLIVSWPEIASPSPALTIASHADRVWLQYRGTDVLACVTAAGVHHAEYLEGTHLLTAESSGAWCFRPTRTRDDVSRTADKPPLPRPRSRPPVILARPGGGTSPINVDGVLVAANFDEQSAHLGDWPHGRLHISVTHDDYEGLTLVTRLNLYDEQGQRLDDVTSYAPMELMEQADTRDYPDRSCAVGGVLYV